MVNPGRTGVQKPGFFAKYSVAADRLSKKPGFLVGVHLGLLAVNFRLVQE